MKILVVSHSCVIDLNQQRYVALARRAGVSLELVVPQAWPSEYSQERLTPRLLPSVRFPVQQLPVCGAGKIPLHFYRSGLGRAVRAAQPDVVYVDEEPYGLPAAQAAAACIARRIPFVVYASQNLVKNYPPPFCWMEQRVYRRAASIVALSEEVRDVLRTKGFRGDCPILTHAVDLERFRPADSSELRRRLGLAGPVVGYLGRLTEAKGVDTLIHALKQVTSVLPGDPPSLLVVGAGPYEDQLRQLAAELGVADRVCWAGAVSHDQAPDYLRCMDVLALPSRTTPSWKEQFGRVLIEAMACGVPVIGSDSGEIPKLIQATGGGLVFAEGRVDDLTKQLAAILTDPRHRQELAATGLASVRRDYSYEAVAEQLHGILQSAARNRVPTI